MTSTNSSDPSSEPDPNNLEGPPPTPEERAANWKELDKLHVGNRFRLMFGLPLLPEDVTVSPPKDLVYDPTLDRHIIPEHVSQAMHLVHDYMMEQGFDCMGPLELRNKRR